MLSKMIFILGSSAALLFFCWILTVFWLRFRGERPDKDPDQLRLGSRTAFAMTHFWKHVDEARELPKETLKEELGNIQKDLPSEKYRPELAPESKGTREGVHYESRKKYRIKENM